jgi:hypothetical protein
VTSDESSLQSQSDPAWKGITRISTIQKIKTQQSAVKFIASGFWDSGEVIYVDLKWSSMERHYKDLHHPKNLDTAVSC